MLTVTDGGTHDWENMPLDDIAFGNAMDCDFTLRSFKKMRREMESKQVDLVYDNLLKSILVTASTIENKGILVDTEYLDEIDEILKDEIEDIKTRLATLSPVSDLNPNSNLELAGILFTSAGFDLQPVSFSEKTKTPQISEQHLLKVKANTDSDDAVEFIELLLKYKFRVKQHKTYVNGIRDAITYNEDGRVYSSYNFGTVVTGRLSCSTYTVGPKKKKGISFHTLPRPDENDNINLRRLMIPDGEKVFIAADFSQAELRMLAQCCRDESLIEAFNSGMDLHKFTASMVFDKPIDDITKQERQIAKSVSFLIVYGGGPHKLSEQIGKPVGYCKSIFAAYQESFPKVFQWINGVHKFVRENEYAVSPFGRRRHLSNVKSPNRKYQYRALRQGMNFIIQSSASDLMLHSIKRLQKYIEASGVSAEILATVHDSVELQCDKEDLDKVLELLKFSLTNTEDFKDNYGLDFVVPFEVDIEVGHSFGDGKEAKFTPEGRLTNLTELYEYIENK